MVDVPGAEVKAKLDAFVKELQQTEAVAEKLKQQAEKATDRIYFLRGSIAALQGLVKPETPQGENSEKAT